MTSRLIVISVIAALSTLFINAKSTCSADESARNPMVGSLASNITRASDTEHDCKQVKVILHDDRRNKDVECRITAPLHADGLCPVFIFSHGALGSDDGYDYLVEFIAKQGYVCVQPRHADSPLNVPKYERRAYARKIIQTLPQDASAWINRARDVSFVVDSLSTLQKHTDVKLDTTKIACGGHSLGAFTASLLAGAHPDAPGPVKSLKDSRISAFIMMSPQGIRHDATSFGFGDMQAWRDMSVPCLFMSGNMDNTKWTDANDRETAFRNCPPANKFMALISGAGHMTFAGVSNEVFAGLPRTEDGSGGSDKVQQTQAMANQLKNNIVQRLNQNMTPEQGNRVVMLQTISAITKTFLDTYLRNEPDARAKLTTAGAFGNIAVVEAR